MAGLTPPRPLTADDDREGFACGRDSLDNWFRRHAWRNQMSGVSRTSIVCDTATGANKLVTTETGLKVQVPLFVNEGDTIKVDTRSGDYLTRV